VADADGTRTAARYAALLAAPPARGVVDVALLSLRADGGVAGLDASSLLLRERADVGAARGPDGLVEVSITLPTLARARAIVLVAVPDCPEAIVQKVLAGDASVPAGRLRHPQFVLYQSGG
jgi:6-phosphogluconolactonase